MEKCCEYKNSFKHFKNKSHIFLLLKGCTREHHIDFYTNTRRRYKPSEKTTTSVQTGSEVELPYNDNRRDDADGDGERGGGRETATKNAARNPGAKRNIPRKEMHCLHQSVPGRHKLAR